MKQNFPPWGTFMTIFTNSATSTFRGWKFFSQFPNIHIYFLFLIIIFDIFSFADSIPLGYVCQCSVCFGDGDRSEAMCWYCDADACCCNIHDRGAPSILVLAGSVKVGQSVGTWIIQSGDTQHPSGAWRARDHAFLAMDPAATGINHRHHAWKKLCLPRYGKLCGMLDISKTYVPARFTSCALYLGGASAAASELSI
jgi:hypothetical protein